MAKKIDTETDITPPKRCIIRAKTPMAWQALMQQAEAKAWRKLRVKLQIREWLMAGKPASLSAGDAMLKARGLEDYIEAVADIVDPDERAQAAERVETDEGLCEFARRPGKEGCWLASNNVKAGLKENWSVLGLRVAVRGSRGALAEGVFVAGVGEGDASERDWIYLGDKPSGVHTAVAHTIGAKGPISSVKRHEYMVRPILEFEIWITNTGTVAEKISDDELAKTLIHFGEHGLGACRSQGYGRFDVLEVYEVEASATGELKAVG